MEPSWSPFLWIAANDLPLRDDLVPFLVARSGQALDDFARWVAPRRPLDWMLSMVQYTAMSTTVGEELLWGFEEAEDPVIEARRQRILEGLLRRSPKVREKLIDEGIEKGIEKGRLDQERAALRRVLAGRRIALSPDDEARIEACSNLATLERWLDRAILATTASEALQDPPA